MTRSSRLVDFLMGFGLPQYESRAYLALLGTGTASAYAVAKAASVPTSKIYQTMQKLERRKMVSRLGDGNGRGHIYAAISAEKFVSDTTSRQKRLGDQLIEALAQSPKRVDNELIWNLNGWDEIEDKILNLVHDAKRYLLVSGWPEELSTLSESLRAAHRRGCQIAMVHYGTPKAAWPFAVYVHRQEKVIARERHGRTFCITADGVNALTAHIPSEGTATAGLSANRTFVGVADDFIRHDIYFLKVMKRFGADLTRRFGGDLRHLRDPFTDTEQRQASQWTRPERQATP